MVRKSGGEGRSVSWKLKKGRKTARKKETGVFRLTGLVTPHRDLRSVHRLISY